LKEIDPMEDQDHQDHTGPAIAPAATTPPPTAPRNSKPGPRGATVTLAGPALEELAILAERLDCGHGAAREAIGAYLSDEDHPERVAALFDAVAKDGRFRMAAALEAQAKALREGV
jgi:hypothetical protein